MSTSNMKRLLSMVLVLVLVVLTLVVLVVLAISLKTSLIKELTACLVVVPDVVVLRVAVISLLIPTSLLKKVVMVLPKIWFSTAVNVVRIAKARVLKMTAVCKLAVIVMVLVKLNKHNV